MWKQEWENSESWNIYSITIKIVISLFIQVTIWKTAHLQYSSQEYTVHVEELLLDSYIWNDVDIHIPLYDQQGREDVSIYRWVLYHVLWNFQTHCPHHMIPSIAAVTQYSCSIDLAPADHAAAPHETPACPVN